MGATCEGTDVREHIADRWIGGLQGCPLHRRGHRARAGRSPCRQGFLGPHRTGRASADPEQDRRSHGGQLDALAPVEVIDNGKPIRETKAADLPLAIDHFRYFAGCLRAQEGSLSEIDQDTIAYHFHEPLGVVGQIIPWNFPILMATWKLAPALAAGNCVVIKPAEQTPASIMLPAELIG